METTTEIFDRKEILAAIQAECLSAEGGSGVLLCHQKVGKSYLLDHVFSRGTENQDSIFCKINIDYLLTSLPEGEKLSDQVFLSAFLRRLKDRFRNWLLQESHWAIELAKTKRQLEALMTAAAPDPDGSRSQFQAYLDLCQRRIDEIATLKEISVTLDGLLSRPTIRLCEVGEVFYSLQSIRKRVVLFIDDYHKVVRNRAFSNALFTFLRGADQQKHLITLASSQLQLMHESLHAGDQERSQLFNHFQPQFLEPFNDELSLAFLEWQSKLNPPLSADEKSYLRELGGRLPYFLRIAKDAFLHNERPAAPARRLEFEGKLAVRLQPAFHDIWLRCSPAKRAILKGIADGTALLSRKNPDVQDLEKEGYIIGGALFSRLFSEFIGQQSNLEPVDEVEASVVFDCGIFPTALAHSCASVPLMTFVLRNDTAGKIEIQLICQLEHYSLENKRIARVAARTPSQLERMAVTPDPERVRKLTAPMRDQVRFQAQWLNAKSQSYLKNETHELIILPLDYFIFARLDKTSSRLTDFTWLIAAWVQKTEFAVEEIKRAARNKHPNHMLGGYSKGVPNPDAHVRDQIKALYDALKDHGLAYDNNAMTFHKDESDFVQRVRLPQRALKDKAANCLEGSVLFASLLSACDLHPIILFIPGHAVVGWKTRDASNAPWEFLDTTVIMNSTFEDACKKGQAYYEEKKKQCTEWEENMPADPTESREIFDHRDFAIPVLIHDVYRSRNLTPLPAL